MEDARPIDPAAVNSAVVVEIRAEMGARRIKPPELSDRTGIPAYALRRLLRGERPPVFGELLAILAVLELDISELAQCALGRARAAGSGAGERQAEAAHIADTFL
jgi:transcriptional regulator with XRE-family HTH domain